MEKVKLTFFYRFVFALNYQTSNKIYLNNGIYGTLKCLSIGTLKAINFPFVSNEKLMFFRCPRIQAHCNEVVIYLNSGAPKIMNFPFGTNGKFIIFRCPNT